MNDATMIPLGYMLKTVAAPAPDWMGAPRVTAVDSMSTCVSSDFADYIPLWQHNGWWLFNSPDAVRSAALSQGIALEALSLFYYEAFDRQYDEQAQSWRDFAPESDFSTNVVAPQTATLSGFDVVSFFVETSAECSPLSCNGLAASLPVNERCLFESFDAAYSALEDGAFRDSEPGPYRIVAVYSVETD